MQPGSLPRGGGKRAARGRKDWHSPGDRGTGSWADGSRGVSWVSGADEGGEQGWTQLPRAAGCIPLRGLWVRVSGFMGLQMAW